MRAGDRRHMLEPFAYRDRFGMRVGAAVQNLSKKILR